MRTSFHVEDLKGTIKKVQIGILSKNAEREDASIPDCRELRF
jgi:hypothetical protein